MKASSAMFSVALVALMTACGGSPTRPAVSLVAAQTGTPTTETVIPSIQPVTLTAQNAVTSQPGVAVTDTFEVATDATFAAIVITKNVPQSAGSQTAVTLDPFTPGTYYWRVKAAAGGASLTSATKTFRIAAVLLAPVLAMPANGVLIGDLDQPVTLAVQNPALPPTVTEITDTFEVATDADFTTIVASSSVPHDLAQSTLAFSMIRMRNALIRFTSWQRCSGYPCHLRQGCAEGGTETKAVI